MKVLSVRGRALMNAVHADDYVNKNYMQIYFNISLFVLRDQVT